jgi:anaphase-promoting complex subunit 2
LKDSLAEKMKRQIEDRLLLPGISTKLIIGFYIQVIRVFKFIDPSNFLLEVVSAPIREYLRTRKDTLKNIVKIILSGENQELQETFGNKYVKIPLKQKHEDAYISSDEDEAAAEAWKPIP